MAIIATADLLASTATLRELTETLLSARFDAYVSRQQREALLMRLAPLVEIVAILQSFQTSRDPKNDKFLDVAVNGRADVTVTGDGDLLALHPFRGIAMLTPAAYLDRQAQRPDK